MFCCLLLAAMLYGLEMTDDSWFLQVAHRITSGEVLYRDVFYGATPLAAYVTAALTALFGTEVLVVKALIALCFVLIVRVSCRIARQLGVSSSTTPVMALAVLVYAWHWAASAYAIMANLFLLICLSATLRWREVEEADGRAARRSFHGAGYLALAGTAAGLSFASKQDLGLYALAALLLTVALALLRTKHGGRQLVVDLLLPLGSFLLTAGLVSLPIWLTGGAERFLDYGFINKGAYVRLGAVSYFDGLTSLLLLVQTTRSWEGLDQVYWQHQFIVPPIAIAGMLAALILGPGNPRSRTTTVLLFVGAALAGVFPRTDRLHLTYAMPALLLGLTYAWSLIKPKVVTRWARALRAILLIWLAIGIGVTLLNPVRWLASGQYEWSDLPHFRGFLIPVAQREQARTFAIALTEETVGERVFLLTPYASLYYLLAGRENPTPFDYPLATAFGIHGEEEVIAAIADGQIRTVCAGYPAWSSGLRPVLLEQYVEEHMERGANIGHCTVYRTPTKIGQNPRA